jgi:hypothetical protein
MMVYLESNILSDVVRSTMIGIQWNVMGGIKFGVFHIDLFWVFFQLGQWYLKWEGHSFKCLYHVATDYIYTIGISFVHVIFNAMTSVLFNIDMDNKHRSVQCSHLSHWSHFTMTRSKQFAKSAGESLPPTQHDSDSSSDSNKLPISLSLEFWLSLCKIVRSSVILLLPLFEI